MAKTRRKLPTICVDEHLPPYVRSGFKDAGFRVVEASRDYRGRDEREYLGEMYAKNEVFVTADQEFVEDVFREGLARHAGIVWLPAAMDHEQRTGGVELAAALIKFHTAEHGHLGMRGVVLYLARDGFRGWDGRTRTDTLIISWDRLMQGRADRPE
jgi:hypothetical protein